MWVVRILFYALTFVCLTLSAYLSYWGYLAHVGSMTPFFVAMIIVSLLMCDISLQKRRELGERLGTILLAMIIPVALSSLSNFNHLYTLFKQDDVVRETLADSFATFRNDLTGTRAQLVAQPALRSQEGARAALDRELNGMWIEITDPTKPGCAQLCREHMARVEEILGLKLPQLGIPPATAQADAFRDFHNRYKEAVYQYFDGDAQYHSARAVRALIVDLDAALSNFRAPEDAIAKGFGLDVLAQLAERSGDIERRANALPGVEVTHHRFDPLVGRVGQIPDTVRNAFVEMPDPTATILSTFFAVVIDLFPLIMVVALLRPGEGVLPRKDQGVLGKIL